MVMNLGCLHMSPVHWDGRVTEILSHFITPISFVKIFMCSYQKSAQPSNQDVCFYNQNIGNSEPG